MDRLVLGVTSCGHSRGGSRVAELAPGTADLVEVRREQPLQPGRISTALRAQRLLLSGDGRGDLLVGRSLAGGLVHAAMVAARSQPGLPISGLVGAMYTCQSRREPPAALADLDPDGRPGLGAHARAEFGVPVIGVAKSAFRTATHAVPVLRGTSARPLYVTAAGMPGTEAADLVRRMAGRYRLPDALRRADALARHGLPYAEADTAAPVERRVTVLRDTSDHA